AALATLKDETNTALKTIKPLLKNLSPDSPIGKSLQALRAALSAIEAAPPAKLTSYQNLPQAELVHEQRMALSDALGAFTQALGDADPTKAPLKNRIDAQFASLMLSTDLKPKSGSYFKDGETLPPPITKILAAYTAKAPHGKTKPPLITIGELQTELGLAPNGVPDCKFGAQTLYRVMTSVFSKLNQSVSQASDSAFKRLEQNLFDLDGIKANQMLLGVQGLDRTMTENPKILELMTTWPALPAFGTTQTGWKDPTSSKQGDKPVDSKRPERWTFAGRVASFLRAQGITVVNGALQSQAGDPVTAPELAKLTGDAVASIDNSIDSTIRHVRTEGLRHITSPAQLQRLEYIKTNFVNASKSVTGNMAADKPATSDVSALEGSNAVTLRYGGDAQTTRRLISAMRTPHTVDTKLFKPSELQTWSNSFGKNASGNDLFTVDANGMAYLEMTDEEFALYSETIDKLSEDSDLGAEMRGIWHETTTALKAANLPTGRLDGRTIDTIIAALEARLVKRAANQAKLAAIDSKAQLAIDKINRKQTVVDAPPPEDVTLTTEQHRVATMSFVPTDHNALIEALLSFMTRDLSTDGDDDVRLADEARRNEKLQDETRQTAEAYTIIVQEKGTEAVHTRREQVQVVDTDVVNGVVFQRNAEGAVLATDVARQGS
ncbi:MAG: hypothetical protein H7338_16190, partial [Candidatus Sericytochromatia bacterium]|nr:hypothetical protein [Candidatus Sericytochromatia bacterium]